MYLAGIVLMMVNLFMTIRKAPKSLPTRPSPSPHRRRHVRRRDEHARPGPRLTAAGRADARPAGRSLLPLASAMSRFFKANGLHRRIEGWPLVFTVLTAGAILVGTVIELAPIFLVGSATAPIATLRPYSPLELEGRDIYIAEGCNNCHSQQVRPFQDEALRYGPASLRARAPTTRRTSGDPSGPDRTSPASAASIRTSGTCATWTTRARRARSPSCRATSTCSRRPGSTSRTLPAPRCAACAASASRTPTDYRRGSPARAPSHRRNSIAASTWSPRAGRSGSPKEIVARSPLPPAPRHRHTRQPDPARPRHQHGFGPGFSRQPRRGHRPPAAARPHSPRTRRIAELNTGSPLRLPDCWRPRRGRTARSPNS